MINLYPSISQTNKSRTTKHLILLTMKSNKQLYASLPQKQLCLTKT